MVDVGPFQNIVNVSWGVSGPEYRVYLGSTEAYLIAAQYTSSTVIETGRGGSNIAGGVVVGNFHGHGLLSAWTQHFIDSGGTILFLSFTGDSSTDLAGRTLTFQGWGTVSLDDMDRIVTLATNYTDESPHGQFVNEAVYPITIDDEDNTFHGPDLGLPDTTYPSVSRSLEESFGSLEDAESYYNSLVASTLNDVPVGTAEGTRYVALLEIPVDAEGPEDWITLQVTYNG